MGVVHGLGLLARHEARRAEGVDPDIGQRPAPGLGPVADVVHVEQPVGKRRVHMHEPPDRTLLHQFARADPLGMVHDHVGLGHQQPRPVPRLDQPVELLGPHRHGLLAQDMLARLDGLQRPFDMEVVGQRDIDRLHLRVGQKLLVGPVHLQPGAKSRKGSAFSGLEVASA
jgi:hypothetical protein